MLKNAKWIQSPVDVEGGVVSFETNIELSKPVAKAQLCASAMGLYEPWLNGKRVTENRFLPGWTNYHKRIQAQTMDVTHLLEEKNALCILCANGWAVGHMGYDGTVKNYADQPALIAELTVEYADGTTEVFSSGADWNVYSSEITFSEIYHGETVDATAPIELLGEAVEMEISAELIPHEGEYVREMDRIPEVRRFVTPKGEQVIDFGQNLAGYAEVRVRGDWGERIVMRHAEILDKDGNFYDENFRAARNLNTYVLSGDGEEVFRPTFSWQGFRYICLDEFPEGALENAEFTAIAVHSDIRRTGRFVCGHAGINQLYHNLIWGQKSNFLDVPTDCPQREERLGWTGDAQVFCQTAALNYDVDRFFRKWLKDLALEQHENGAVPGIVPVVMKVRKTRISAAWGDAAVICPWVLYLTYGDKKVLEDQFDSMCGWIHYIRDHAEGGPHLWLGGYHYGDWLALDNGDGVYEGRTDKEMIATAYYAYSTSLLIKAGHVIGRDVSEYEALYPKIVEAFTEKFTKDGLPVDDTQTACAVMLFFGLCADEKKVAGRLAQLIVENGRRLNTGFVGTPYLMYALSEHGYADLAYDLLLQEQFPSWLYSVRMGATTIWEHWDGVNEEGRMWSTNMNSFNHYAYGAVGEWMYRTVAGIRTVEEAPGFEKVLLCPVPDARLGFAEASIETKRGTIRSAWHITGDGVRFDFSVPEGVEAKVVLPDGREEVFCGGDRQYLI